MRTKRFSRIARWAMATATLVMSFAFADNARAEDSRVNVLTKLNGTLVTTGGGEVKVTEGATSVELTVTPASGNYFETTDLTVVRTIDAGKAQARRRSDDSSSESPDFDPKVSVTLVGKANLNGKNTFTFDLDKDENICYEVTANFHSRISITENYKISIEKGPGENGNYVYSGNVIKPTVTLAIGNTPLTENTDFTVTYADNTNAGTGKVTLDGIGKYTSQLTGSGVNSIAALQFTIEKAEIKPVVSIEGWTYGDKANIPEVKKGNPGGGGVSYEFKEKDAGDDKYSTAMPTSANNYIVKAFVNETDNYKGGTGTAEFTIKKKSLTVTADDKNIAYGDEPPTYTVKYSGFVNDEDEDVLSGKLAFTCSYQKGDGIDSYPITPSGLTSGNYDITFKAGTLTVDKTNISTTAPKAIDNLIYNGKSQALVTEGSTNAGEMQYSLDGKKYDKAIPTGTDAKEYTVYYTVVADGNYNAVDPKVVNVSIGKTALTVQAEDKTVNYGDEPPTYTVKYSGFVNNETASVLSGELAFACKYQQGDGVGSYPITPSGLTSGNYDITFKAGTLTVDKTNMSEVVIGKIPDQNYTGEAIKPQMTVTFNNVELADDEYKVEYENNVNAGEATVKVISTGKSFAQGSTKTATFNINPASIERASVTIDPTATYTYTGSEIKPVVTVTLNNKEVAKDDYVVSYENNINAATADAEKAPTIKITGKRNFENSTSKSVKFTIKKATLTITAQSHAFMYTGEAQSWNKYDVEGLVGNDQISAVVEGSITFPNESPVANTVKSYAFTSGTADNYDVTTKNGELTMTYANAAITITAASNSWVYDGNAHTAPEVTITQGALLAGDALVATASGSVTDVADTKNGNNPVADGYKVMHGDKDVSANYVITTEAGTLTITIKTVDNPVIILTPESFEYDGTPIEQKPAVVVKDGDRIIPESEYSVSYSNNIEVGTATVTITDNEGGNYIVNGTVNFTIGDKTFDWNGVKIVVTDYANHLAKVIELTPNPYGSVVIPESIEGYTITTIDPDAVKGKTDLTDIFLPDTKEPLDIKEGAFYINDYQTPAVHVTEELLNDYALIPALDKQLETANLVTELSSRNRYRTFACVVDVIIPEDLGVYTCHHESSSVRMTPLDNKELMVGGQRMIRAGNGVLLICAKYGNEIRAKKPESQNFYQGNELVAVTTDTHFAAGEYYVLKDNEFHVIDADDVSSVKAGHAVLPVKDKNARSLTIIGEDDATRINAVDSDEAGDIWYDLMGNRISRPLRKGLYIHNGKKEIVR